MQIQVRSLIEYSYKTVISMTLTVACLVVPGCVLRPGSFDVIYCAANYKTA